MNLKQHSATKKLFLVTVLVFLFSKNANSQWIEKNGIGLSQPESQMPVWAGYGSQVTSFGNKAFVLQQLGDDFLQQVIRNSILSYDPNSNHWQKITQVPSNVYNGVFFNVYGENYFTCGYGNYHLWKWDTLSQSWIQKSNFPAGSRTDCSAFVENNKAYLIGGRDSVGTLKSDCWEYDPISDQWTQKNNFPGGTRRNALTWSFDTVAYLGLGISSGSHRTDMWRYDALSDTWTQKSSFPGSTSSFIYNNLSIDTSCYVFVPTTASNTEFWKYDPFNDAWIQKTTINVLNSVGFSVNSKGYILSNNGSLRLDEYDPITDTWTNKMTETPSTLNGKGISFGNKGYVGGKVYDPQFDTWATDTFSGTWLFTCNNKVYANLNASLQEYNPSTNTWSMKNLPPANVGFEASLFELNGKAYFEASNTTYNSLYEYDPVADSWTLRGSMPGDAAMNINAGAVSYSIGTKGYFGLGVTLSGCGSDSIFEYDPVMNTWSPIHIFPHIRLGAFGVSCNNNAYIAYGNNCSSGGINPSDGALYSYDPASDTWRAGGSTIPRDISFSLVINNVPYVGGGTTRVSQDYGSYAHYDVYQIDTTYFSTHHRVSGTVYIDLNNNGQHDTLEFGMSNVTIELDTPAVTTTAISYLGTYSFIVHDSAYLVKAIPPAGYHISQPQTTYSINLNGSDIDSLDFGLYPDVPVPANIDVTVMSGFPRCMTSVDYTISGINTGVSNSNGIIIFHPDTQTTFQSSTPSPDSIVGNNYYYSYSALIPYLDQTFATITLNLPGAGITLNSSVEMYAFDATGSVLDTSIYYLTQYTACSFDPNNKEVNPAESATVNPNSFYTYTIHFQNTGNDTAWNVNIIDTIDGSLDISTFEILSSSHICQPEIFGNHVIFFRFENIQLPDSGIDLSGSEGYVSYRIKPLPGTQAGTHIFNTAHILFDYNDAVSTNTTENVLDQLQSTNAPLNTGSITCSPNPFHTTTRVKINNHTGEEENLIKVYDSKGVLIRNYGIAKSSELIIERGSLPDGYYILEIENQLTKGKRYLKLIVI